MKKIYNATCLAILAALVLPITGNGQGCVAIRSFSGCGSASGASSSFLQPGESIVGANFRYFQSYKHFRGAHEEVNRVEDGTQVINDSYFLDLTFSYAFSNRFFGGIVVPLTYHERSSMYEHGGNDLGDRHTTYAQGLSDVRVNAGYWLFSPEKHLKHNVSVALGVKLPTGKSDATGTFYNVGPNGKPETRYLDQSIQPGDGGFGITGELQAYRQLGHLTLSGNFYYLINPRETIDVRRRPGSDPYSVPDQYAARLGLSYMTSIQGLSAYFGGRIEGIPAIDLVGGSEGFRRPGYAISIEPGLSYSANSFNFNVTVPVAISRNRIKSFSDRQTGRHGDAAFADYLVNAGVTWKFGGKKKVVEIPVKMDVH